MSAVEPDERWRRRRSMSQLKGRIPPTSLFLFGLLAGLVVALYYAWIVSPVVYVDAGPARLSDGFKAEYIFLVSQSYALDEDWPRALARLEALGDAHLSETVAVQLEGYLRRGAPAETVRNLAIVAEKLGVRRPSVAIFAPTPAALTTATLTPDTAVVPTLLPTPTLTRLPTETPAPTVTPLPTLTLTPTPPPVYRLLSQQRVCQRDAPAPRIEVYTVDQLLEPLPGAAVLVSWDNGADRFYTGFKPDVDPGYGDFTMLPDISYSVTLLEGSPTISGLRSETCPQNQGGWAGGWRLTFQNLRR
jgi:hypothetical protein